jgi:hypothetical protein
VHLEQLSRLWKVCAAAKGKAWPQDQRETAAKTLLCIYKNEGATVVLRTWKFFAIKKKYFYH